MRKLVIILLVLVVFLSGCVGQPVAKVETTTTTTQQVAVEEPEFTHDLDQALEDLNQLE